MNIQEYIQARYSILVIESFEEERVLKELEAVAEKINEELKAKARQAKDPRAAASDIGKNPYKLYEWSATHGLKCNGKPPDPQTKDFRTAIDSCENMARQGLRCLFVFCDAHTFLADQSCNASLAVNRRRLKEFAINIRSKGYSCNCFIVTPHFEASNDLQKEVTFIDFPLPTKDEMRIAIRGFVDGYRDLKNVAIAVDDQLLERYVDASLGLTKLEAENCLSRALVSERRLDQDTLKTIINEKKQIIRKTGILEFIDTNLNLEDVGGLQTLKKWLELRSHCFGNNAKDFGVQPPKGVLLTGVPGCGKSLTAKCVASAWNMPLLRLDMGKIFQGLVGSSESNIRLALRTAEAVAPSILWIDEIEKGLSGSGGHGGDGGTSTRVFGTLLTWMQEKKSPVFVFATANNIDRLPPELLRKGRFDEIFFVDFPSWEERKKILDIHIKKLNRDPSRFDRDRLATLSGETTFGKDVVLSGAEIEAWVGDSLIEAFSRRVKGDKEADLEMADFETTIRRIVPMGQMRKDDFRRLREWANANAVSASVSASAKDAVMASPPGGDETPEQFMAGRKLDF